MQIIGGRTGTLPCLCKLCFELKIALSVRSKSSPLLDGLQSTTRGLAASCELPIPNLTIYSSLAGNALRIRYENSASGPQLPATPPTCPRTGCSELFPASYTTNPCFSQAQIGTPESL